MAELAEVMELTPKKVRMIRKAVRAFQRPAQTGGDGEERLDLAETLCDHRLAPPDQDVANQDDLNTVLRLLEAIDDREATILRLRFGLDGDEPLTLKEVGERVGLTRERVRQIEIEALNKLNRRMLSRNPFSEEHEPPKRRRRSKKTPRGNGSDHGSARPPRRAAPGPRAKSKGIEGEAA